MELLGKYEKIVIFLHGREFYWDSMMTAVAHLQETWWKIQFWLQMARFMSWLQLLLNLKTKNLYLYQVWLWKAHLLLSCS
ncbi:unnamed protein product [Blepharisma stoltei]|uniref:Uncharacterized protein n=1 Tax=Blepharisma stoltei TaxID=1481888 RepID=A0AAU9IJX1_9CILI|nr:unnamed protein product [Blepharisma stoltei]